MIEIPVFYVEYKDARSAACKPGQEKVIGRPGCIVVRFATSRIVVLAQLQKVTDAREDDLGRHGGQNQAG